MYTVNIRTQASIHQTDIYKTNFDHGPRVSRFEKEKNLVLINAHDLVYARGTRSWSKVDRPLILAIDVKIDVSSDRFVC